MTNEPGLGGDPTAQGSQRAVFLSYASDDADAAARICASLRAAGIEVWFDQSELRSGDAWDQKIRREIHDCAFFVPVISRNTQARTEGYFRLEWHLADQRTHLMAKSRAFLLPVCVDDTRETDAEVPDSFLSVQWTRLPAGTTTSAFVERVLHLLSPAEHVAPAQIRQPSGATSIAHGGTSPAPAAKSLLPPVSRRSRQSLLVIAAVVVIAAGYLAVDRLFVSKRSAETGRASSPAAPAGTPGQSAIREKSIAVLPFVDMSEKRDQEYFADGMAEEVLDLLAKIPGIRVIGRTSSFQFKGKSGDLRTIGTTLGAAYILEGSVRKSGNRLRVTAQLISAQDGSHLWSETYDGLSGDALKVQDEIAAGLVRALQVTIGADDVRASRTLASPDAYDLYLRGRHALDHYDQTGFETAAGYFQQSLDVDPSDERAAEWLGVVENDRAIWGFVPPREGFERARLAAQRALKLNPRSGLAHTVLAVIHSVYDWDWAATERESAQALALEPGSPFVIGNTGYARSAFDRPEETARLMRASIALDPLFAPWHEVLGLARYRSGALAEAEAEIRKVFDISRSYVGAHWDLGQILLAAGNPEAALLETQQEAPEGGRDAGLAIAYHALRRKTESDVALAGYTKDHAIGNAYVIAEAHAYRGERDEAFMWLERAYQQKDSALFWIRGDPLLKNLVGDPRYAAFLRKMKLPQ